MRKLFLIVPILVVMCARAQSPIDRIEYFFNTDPGFGQANAAFFTPANNIADLHFSPDISILPAGINRLHVRSRSSSGIWSQTASQAFFKVAPLAASPLAMIDRIEYFFNTDPGLGQATTVSFTAATSINDLGFAIDISGLPAGINRLFIRSRDGDGKWSQVANQVFYKLLPISAQATAPISRMEYFINTDPGIGNAIPVVFYKADSLADLSFPVNISGLTAGQHLLYLRSSDTLGKWSLTAIDTIQINTAVAQSAIIVNSLLLNPEGLPLDGFTQRITGTATLCAGNEIRMAFDPSGTYNAGNVFTVQLSDATGAFSSPINIGTVNGIKGAATICRLPRHLPAGVNYKVRVVSSNPVVIGDPTTDNIIINDINIGPDVTAYLSCPGTTANLLALYNTSGLNAQWNTAAPATAAVGNYILIVNDEKNCPDTALVEVKLEVATWTGTASNNWHNPANWNINKVPGLLTHVIIPAGTTNNCTISAADGEAASVQARTGALINLTNNRKLLIAQNCETLPPG